MAAIALGGLMLITRIPAAADIEVTYAVGFAPAQEIIVKRCVPCHSTHPADPAFPAPPNNATALGARGVRTAVEFKFVRKMAGLRERDRRTSRRSYRDCLEVERGEAEIRAQLRSRSASSSIDRE